MNAYRSILDDDESATQAVINSIPLYQGVFKKIFFDHHFKLRSIVLPGKKECSDKEINDNMIFDGFMGSDSGQYVIFATYDYSKDYFVLHLVYGAGSLTDRTLNVAIRNIQDLETYANVIDKVIYAYNSYRKDPLLVLAYIDPKSSILHLNDEYAIFVYIHDMILFRENPKLIERFF